MENTELTIFTQLEKVSLKVNVKENAPKSDLEFMRLLQEGEETDDINKIYQFVEACERGCGLIQNEMIHKMIVEAYNENPEILMAILAKKTFFEQCIFISACEQYMINKFIILGVADSMKFLYECLRKTLINGINGNRENEEAFIQGIIVLSMKSKELWKRWIKKHEHNKQWQRVLNEVLPKLNKEALVIYVDNIDISIDVTQGQEIYRTINEIPAEKMQGIQNLISKPLCLRWRSYLEELRQAKTYHDNVKKLAYAGLILPAIRYYECGTLYDWEQAVISNIDILLNHMTQWYKSYTEFKSIFWIDYTQIYYLMSIGDECSYAQKDVVQRKLQELELFFERNKYLI